MKRFTVAFVAISGCVLGPACQAIVGIEDRAEAPALGGAGDAAPDVVETVSPGFDAQPDVDAEPPPLPPAGCPAGCLPPAPTGWTGPSATYDGAPMTKPADCPAGYTVKEIDAHQNMTAAPAVCDCGTGTVSGRFCSAGISGYASQCLGGATDLGTVTTTQGCFATVVNGPAAYKVAAPVLTAGACSFPNAKTTVPEPAFAKVDVACGLSEVTQCAGRPECIATPAPAQPYGRLCIHKEGEHSCPSADYSVKLVAYKKVADSRACTTCTATPSGTGCATGQWVHRVSMKDCGDTLGVGTKYDANTCNTYSGAGTIVDITAWKPGAATCPVQGGAPSGTASSIEPVTLCCAP